jgi:hypothetical protein
MGWRSELNNSLHSRRFFPTRRMRAGLATLPPRNLSS